jgi:hypothetical protein
MTELLTGSSILITGGTGSLGQTLVRRLLRGELGVPEKLIVSSRDEAKQHAMKATWKHLHRPTDDVWYHNFDELIEFQIGDVRDYDSVQRAVSRCDVILYEAAMKQVPTCEYFPGQAVAENVVRAAARTERVRTLVGISTDKACKPVNVSGNPITDVLERFRPGWESSGVLEALQIDVHDYLLVTAHQQETVDVPRRLSALHRLEPCRRRARQAADLERPSTDPSASGGHGHHAARGHSSGGAVRVPRLRRAAGVGVLRFDRQRHRAGGVQLAPRARRHLS